MTTTPSESMATAPNSVLNANPVIVGGGPVGLFTAILLDQRRISVTVIEKQKDYNAFKVPLQYFLVIFEKGRRAFSCVPGLWETISENGFAFDKAKIAFYTPDGGCKPAEFSSGKTDGQVNVRLLRPSLVNILKDYITQNCGHVTCLYGTSVKHSEIGENGEIELLLDKDGEETVLRSRLVLACDGKNSVVAEDLHKAESERGKSLVQSSHGLHIVSRDSPAVGMKIKGVLLNRTFMENMKSGKPEDTDSKVNILVGRKGYSPNRAFNIGVFPVNPQDIEAMGGYLAGTARRPDHKLWELRDAEEGFKLFEENFPQIDIRKCITTESMKEFIECRPSKFGYVSRRGSLVANVGRDGSGGVVLLGDAAHSFPPDIGQGVSVGLEDARLFAEILGSCEQDCHLREILQLYERRRDDDTSALMKIAQVAAPYQYGQNKFRLQLYGLNVMTRRALADVFPGLMYPALISMVAEDSSYRDMLRKAERTTVLLSVGVALGIGSVVTAIMASRMFG